MVYRYNYALSSSKGSFTIKQFGDIVTEADAFLLYQKPRPRLILYTVPVPYVRFASTTFAFRNLYIDMGACISSDQGYYYTKIAQTV
jgi:hypothetical protein